MTGAPDPAGGLQPLSEAQRRPDATPQGGYGSESQLRSAMSADAAQSRMPLMPATAVSLSS